MSAAPRRVLLLRAIDEVSTVIIGEAMIAALTALPDRGTHYTLFRPPYRRLPLRFQFKLGRQPISGAALDDYVARLLWYPLAARHQPADVYHVTDDRYGAAVRWLGPRRCVVTVNHGTPEILRDELAVGTGVLFRVQRYVFNAICQAAYVVTASNVMREHILSHYALDPERVVANPYGVAPLFRPQSSDEAQASRVRHGLARDWFVLLHVGNCGLNKNIETLLRALPNLPPHVHLVQAGCTWTAHQQALIDQYALGARVHSLGMLAHAGPELAALYRAADAFVFPSLLEGFGLPLVEAMASGLPTVTSNFGTMAEVAGGGAQQVDTRDPAAIAAAVRLLLDSPEARQHWRAAGLRRAQDFSWRRHAETLRDLYADVHARNQRASA